MIPFAPAAQLESSASNALKNRRGGKLLNLDKMLLHSPPYAAGWNALLGNVRNNLLVSDKLSELVILGVAILNNAPYEFIQHIQPYESAGSSRIQREILKTLMDQQVQDFDMIINDSFCTEFDDVEKDVLRLTYATTILSSKVSTKEKEALYDRLKNTLPSYPGTKRVGGNNCATDDNSKNRHSISNRDDTVPDDEMELKVDSSLEMLMTAGSTDINSSILAAWEADDRRMSMNVPPRGGEPAGGRKSMGVLEDAYVMALADFRNKNQNEVDYSIITSNDDKTDRKYANSDDWSKKSENVHNEGHSSWQGRLHHLNDTGSVSDNSSISGSDNNDGDGGKADGQADAINIDPAQGDSLSNHSSNSDKSYNVGSESSSNDKGTPSPANDADLNSRGSSGGSSGSGSGSGSDSGSSTFSSGVPTPEVARMDSDSNPVDCWNEHSRRKNTTSQIVFGDDSNYLADPKIPELRKNLSKERNEQKNTQSHILFGDDLAIINAEAENDRGIARQSGGSERLSEEFSKSQLTSPQSTYSAMSSPGDYDADLYVDLRKLSDVNEKLDANDANDDGNGNIEYNTGNPARGTSKKGGKKKGLTLLEILEQKEAAETAASPTTIEQPKSRNRKSLTMMDLLDKSPSPQGPHNQAPNSNDRRESDQQEVEREKNIPGMRDLHVTTYYEDNTTSNSVIEPFLRSTSSPESMMFETGKTNRPPLFAAEHRPQINLIMEDANEGTELKLEDPTEGTSMVPMGGDMSPALSLKNVGAAITPAAVVPKMRQDYNYNDDIDIEDNRKEAEKREEGYGAVSYTEPLVSLTPEELGNRCLVELIGVVSTYNMVSRFLLACKIQPETQGMSALASPTNRGIIDGDRRVMEGKELQSASNIDKSVFVLDNM
jgi:hypothetical protein